MPLWMTSYCNEFHYMELKAPKPYTALRNWELSGPSAMWILERKGWAFFFAYSLSFYWVWGCSHFTRRTKKKLKSSIYAGRLLLSMLNIYVRIYRYKRRNQIWGRICVPKVWLTLFFFKIGIIIVWQSVPKNPASCTTLDNHKLQQFHYYKRLFFFLSQKKCMPVASPLEPLFP